MKWLLTCFILFLPALLPAQINHIYGDVIINEVMADPVGLNELPATEYIEIYNTTNEGVALKDWAFIYVINASSGTVVTLPDIVLPPNGYAVLFRAGREIQVDNTGIGLPASNFPASLANAGKHLQLKDSSGLIIDSVTYAEAKPARSWERDMDAGWYLSTDPRGGTPGSANSSKELPEPPVITLPDYSEPGNVIINEIMANPVGLTLLPETEYVEIYNTLDSTVMLYNWNFIYDGKIYAIPDTLLEAGQYAILFKADKNIHIDPTGIALGIDKFPVLANNGKTIGLKNAHAIEIDLVTYATAKSGQSWERDTDNSWYLSADPRGGTPGSVNSQKEIPEPPIVRPPDPSKPGDVIINEIMANPVGLTLLPETEYIEIYNASDSAISLYSWNFIYDGKKYTIPDTVLQMGQYAILFKADKNTHIDPTGIALGIDNFPVLANNGKTIGLINAREIEIDRVAYTTAKPARSCERDTEGEWYLSNDPRGGTPGTVNSPKSIPEPPVNPLDHSILGDVIINEIMANPTGLTELPETEYVELYNTSGSAISLSNWTFVYDGRDIAFPDTILAAGSYVVLFRSGRDIHIGNTGLALPMDNFPANLANNGRTIQIKNAHQLIIDSVSYAPAKAARSWERDTEGDWYLSNDLKGGTPGTMNSPKSIPEPPVNPLDHSILGDVIINEVMANPTGLTELPETEYVELYNTSGAAIYLSNWTFVYDGKDIAFPDTIVAAGSYVVLFRSGRDIHIGNTGLALPMDNFPANLANNGRTIQIKNSHQLIIDSVSYAPAKAARSWERDMEGEWYLSTDPRGGTPGSANSAKELPKPPVITLPDYSEPGNVIINEIMANPVGLTLLPETEYVEIYNILDSTIMLYNWTFIYDGKIYAIPDTFLEAGQYAILFRADKNIHVDPTGIALGINNFPVLANNGKTIGIKNSHGIIIDSINYAAAKPGRSWERDIHSEWHLSNDQRGGTPGSVNSSKETIIPPIDPERPIISDNSDPGDIIINEVMANAVGLTKLPETEYVELYNTLDSAIYIKGWSFIYDGKKTAIPDTLLSANQYAVLFREGRDILYAEHTGIALPMADFPANLANTGKTLEIRNSLLAVIDSISYKTAKPGRSWERDNQGNWYLSNDPKGGTPGAINSSGESPPINPGNPNDTISSLTFIVYEHELIFNELLPDPFAGGSEFIELYNRSERTLSLTDLSVATTKADGALSTRYPLTSIPDSVYPGQYIVLTGNRNGVLDFYYTSAPEVIYELKLPALNNTGATLVLLRTHDKFVIDRLTYSSKWHDIAIKNTKGVSLERIHPDIDTQSATNWTSAIAMEGYGTPGYKNSQHGNSNDEQTIFVSTPEYNPAFDEYIITYQTDQPGYRCRIEIYTTEGRRIAEISNNQLMGTTGEIRWNGFGSDGNRLQSGIYIFYAELYHPNGKQKAYKKALLIQ